MRHDRSRFHLRLKKFLYGRKNFVIVTPSAWLESQVHRSFMKDIPTHVIHSPIDTRLFYPEDKKAARERLGIPHDKKVVLFIASWVNTIPHKGVGTFKEMLSHLCETHSDIYPIIVGHLQGQSVLGDRFPGKETGWVNDVETMRACYASSDIFISPTLAENSSCTIMEALACGTPTVAYRTGGIPEQIVHGETGILVPPGDHRALLESITSLLNDSGMRLHFSNASVQRAKSHFALDVCLDKYLKVYDTAIRMK
jgi:glycosyltransferase involved in cell wall biosynthesis